LIGGNARDDHYGLDMDGRINGTTNPGAPGLGAPAGLTRDLTVLHEGAFTFAGTNDTGPKWKGTIVVGDMLGQGGFGNQSQITPQQGFGYSSPVEDVYVQDFSVKFNTSVAGLAFNAEAGRVGYKISPYIYQRLDTTSYYHNERWDNGKYYFDGGILGFNFGGAKLDVFGGTTPGNSVVGQVGSSVNSTTVGPVTSGPINGSFAPGGASMAFNRQLGADLNVPLTSAGNLNLAYLWLEANDTTAATLNANRLSVFGGTVDFNLSKIKVSGGYSQTTFSTTPPTSSRTTTRRGTANWRTTATSGASGATTERSRLTTSLPVTGVDLALSETRPTSRASKLAVTST